MKTAHVVVSVLVAASPVPSKAAQELLEFPTRVFPGVGWSQGRFAVDFDRDGALDVLIMGPSRTQLHRGDGHGAFAAHQPIVGSEGLRFDEFADFDGDGRLDGLGLEAASARTVLALGDSSGGFGPRSVVYAQPLKHAHSADFDEDGALDVVGWSVENQQLVALSNGPTGFHPTNSLGVTAVVTSIACGDFDCDGHVDIAFATASAVASENEVLVLRGDGQGAFASAERINTSYAPYVHAGDLESDGRDELLVTNGYGLDIFRRAASGAYSRQHVDGSFDRNLPRGDFDSDGDLDFLVQRDFVSHVLLGEGDGGFSVAAELHQGVEHGADAIADFNGDGFADFVFVCGIGDFAVTLSDGRGGWGRHYELRSADPSIVLARGDLNADGNIDVVLKTVDALESWIGDGLGQFTPRSRVAALSARTSIELRDLDSDGDLDLVDLGAVGTSVRTHLNDGTGRFASATSSAWTVGGPGVLGDFDGDGASDYLGYGATLELHRGDGLGGFGAAIVSTPTNAISWNVTVAVRDFNGDGIDDLCGARDDSGSSLSGTIDTYFGAANAPFAGPASTVVDELPRGLCAGDFDADGVADIAYLQSQAGELRFARGDGSGRFTSSVRTPVPGVFLYSYALQVDRFDRDQRDDVAFLPPYGFGAFNSTPLAICLTRPDGAFHEPVFVPLGYKLQRFVSADVDSDGRADLIYTDATTDRPTLVLQR